MSKLLLIAIIFVNAFLAYEVNAEDAVVAGWVERVTLFSSQTRVKAKLDTGAKTSSIHAENIKTYLKSAQNWVRFDTPFENDHIEHFDLPVVRSVLIKQHNRPSARRIVVRLPFCMNGVSYETEFTLTNRGNYNYPILLGRSFLKKKFIINPSKKYMLRKWKTCSGPEAQ